MKRIFTFGLLVAAVFALTNCAQKESYAPVQEEVAETVTFEIVANLPAETKTYNEGISTKWSPDDEIRCIFTNQNGETDETDNPFYHEGNGKFVGNLEREFIYGFLSSFSGGSIYAVYPYDSDGTIPASTVQNGYGSKAHLAGPNCPLAGSITLSWDQDWLDLILSRKYNLPEVMLEHLTSVIEVTVTNNTADSVNVNEVNFLVGGEVKATTIVGNPSPLATGEIALVYIVVEPGTYSDLSFTVNNDAFVKNIKAAEATFTAGMIKKVNFVIE